MASKIRELNDIVKTQTETVRTLRLEKKAAREALVAFYNGVVKYKPEYAANATIVEDATLDDIKSEDLATARMETLIMKLARSFQTVITSLDQNRSEVKAMYTELDINVGAAIDEWNKTQAEDRADQKAETFRKDTVSHASIPRPQTPEILVPPTAHISSGPSPPSPPDSTYESHTGKEQAGKQKTTAKPLSDVLSSKTATPMPKNVPAGNKRK